jgi:antitoxin component of MazEF toxin-antitoxin module
MFTGKLRRVGNSVVLTIPADEIERQGLVVGQHVVAEVSAAQLRPALRPELAARMEALLAVHGPALDYLKDK